jgi:hypothetical protein
MKREWDNGWQGGKFSATPLQRKAMLTFNGRRTHLFGTSEALGLQPLPGWGMTSGECVVTWHKDTWKLEDHGHFSIRTPRWIRGTSVRHSVEFYWTLLDIVAHLPAHLFKFFQQRANTVALREMSKHIEQLQVWKEPDETDLAMDANRDMRLAKNVDLMRRSLVGTGMHLIIPPAGTEGDRKIDLRASTATRVGPGVMFGHHSGLDHVGFKNHHLSVVKE